MKQVLLSEFVEDHFAGFWPLRIRFQGPRERKSCSAYLARDVRIFLGRDTKGLHGGAPLQDGIDLAFLIQKDIGI
jgi:hypothetical protein